MDLTPVKEAASEFLTDRGCPLMFGPTADAGHKLMGWFLKASGNVPRRV